jgi:hypothetical protein
MKNIQEIAAALATAAAGTVLMIRGYVNSAGDRNDIEVELLPPGAYYQTLREDLQMLRAADVTKIGSEEAGGDLQLTDLITAKDQLIASRTSSIDKQDSDEEPTRKGPDFITVGPNTARLQGEAEALYIRGVKILNDELAKPRPAKGAIPRAKQQIAEALDLPTRRYVHNLKLEPGKFEDLQIFLAE